MTAPPPSPVPRTVPSVSVVVPVYNGEAFVPGCIDCLKRQTLPDFECIFVDDSSSDGTAAAVERFSAGDSRFRLLRQPERTDPFRCRRAGVLAATGGCVMFLDVDDELVPEACETALAVIEREGADVFIFGTTVVPEPGIPDEEAAGTQRFMDTEPRKGRMDVTPETLPILFEKKSWSPSVWNKIVRAGILKRIYAEAPSDEYLGYGQDFLQTILVFLSIRTLYSNVGTKLHRYHLGRGATVRAKGGLDWTRFVRIQSSSNTARALSGRLRGRTDLPAGLAADIEERFTSNFRENAARYVWFLPPDDIPRGLEHAFRAWGVDLFGTRAFSATAVSEYLGPVLRSPVLASPERAVRTVCVLGQDPDEECPERTVAADALEESLASAGFRVLRIAESDLSPPDETEHGPSNPAAASRQRVLEARLEAEDVDFAFLAHSTGPHVLSDAFCVRALGRGAAIVFPGDSRESAFESGIVPFFRLQLALRIAGRSVEFAGDRRPDKAVPSDPARAVVGDGPFDWKRWFAARPPAGPTDAAIPESDVLGLLARLAASQENANRNASGRLRKQQRQIDRLNKKLSAAERTLETVRRSISFRIGRFLTRPLAFLVRR